MGLSPSKGLSISRPRLLSSVAATGVILAFIALGLLSRRKSSSSCRDLSKDLKNPQTAKEEIDGNQIENEGIAFKRDEVDARNEVEEQEDREIQAESLDSQQEFFFDLIKTYSGLDDGNFGQDERNLDSIAADVVVTDSRESAHSQNYSQEQKATEHFSAQTVLQLQEKLALLQVEVEKFRGRS